MEYILYGARDKSFSKLYNDIHSNMLFLALTHTMAFKGHQGFEMIKYPVMNVRRILTLEYLMQQVSEEK